MERKIYSNGEAEHLCTFDVIKFGGTSLGNSQMVNRCIETVRCGVFQAVVVSAPGKTTNLLEEMLDRHLPLKDDSKVLDIYHALQEELGLPEPNLIDNCIADLSNRLISNERDSVLAWGEWSMAQIFAAKMGATFVDSAEVLKVVEDSNGDRMIHESSADLVNRKFDNSSGVLVFSGFYGSSLMDNKVMTLNRGGSDYVGVYIASCIGSGLVKSTDVDGLLDFGGNVISNANFCDLIAFDKNVQLINKQARDYAQCTGTRIWVKNSIKIDAQGTIIS